MKRFPVLVSFVPWFIFAVLYGNSKHQILQAAIITLLMILILNRRELKNGFILPWASLIYFGIVALNSLFDWVPWFLYHSAMTINLALAVIIWISIIIKKPFTLQYAKEMVPASYWNMPGFLKINFYLSLSWAALLTVSALPTLFIPQEIYLKSLFWNYGLTAICILIAIYLNKELPGFIMGRNFWQQVAKLIPVNSPYLQSGFAPVHEELNIADLIVEGILPEDLNGSYLRNGPNPYFTPYTYTYPIDGDGMIHRLIFKNGSVSYQNRFVMTKGLQAEIKIGKALYAGIELPIPADPKFVGEEKSKNTAAIHIIKWQDKFLALYEQATAYLLDNKLNTLGEWVPDGSKGAFMVNAHHRVDPQNGHTFMFTYDVVWEKPYLQVYEFNANKELIKTIPVNKSRSTMIHDLVITANYIILFDVPAIFNVAGNDGSEKFFYFDENLPVTIILIKRSDYTITTIDNVPNFFVFHFSNAYEIENKIIIDFIYHNKLDLKPILNDNYDNIPKLYQAQIDLSNMKYTHKELLNEIAEFPIYNLTYTGLKYRYSYFLSKNVGNFWFNRLIKYDHLNNLAKMIDFGESYELDEPIFIPKMNSQFEDDGYIGVYLYNKETNKSSFVLYDALTLETPLAKVRLPVRVPHGLHGSWITD